MVHFMESFYNKSECWQIWRNCFLLHQGQFIQVFYQLFQHKASYQFQDIYGISNAGNMLPLLLQ